MITKPKDWESAMSYDGESGKRMTPGGHVCQITNIRQENSKAGKPMIVVSFDIAEGSDLDGFYLEQYREAKKNGRDARWGGVIRYLLYDDNGLTNPFFKGFVKSLEESNPGYTWDWNEGSATRKKIGIVMREEEYLSRQGTIKTSVKAWRARSVQAILDGVLVPDKLEYKERPKQPYNPTAGFTAADDEELPF